MRKVAWPTRAETDQLLDRRVHHPGFLMALIFVLDLAFSKFAIFLFK